jgi:hypothetical protein
VVLIVMYGCYCGYELMLVLSRTSMSVSYYDMPTMIEFRQRINWKKHGTANFECEKKET